MADELTWSKRAAIGAAGGASLAILKLIDARFYLGSVSSTEAAVGYLTYCAYVVLGCAAAIFLVDHELPIPKMMRSSFVLGLLAPSVLLAIATQPVRQGRLQSDDIGTPPKIGGLFVPSALAEEPAKSDPKPAVTSIVAGIVTFKKADLEPTVGEALLSAVGRKEIVTPYAYVVGTTQDRDKALAVSKKMNLVLLGARGDVKPKTSVVKAEGGSNYFITVGDIQAPAETLHLRSVARSAAIDALAAGATPDSKQVATWLLEGKVLPARALLD